MLLHSLNGSHTIQHPLFGTIEADGNGVFRVPDELGNELLNIHVDGQPIFETDTAHVGRIATEELARRRDPAALYDLLSQGASPAVPPADTAQDDAAIEAARAADAAELQKQADEAAAEQAAQDAANVSQGSDDGSSTTSAPDASGPVIDPDDPKAEAKLAAIAEHDYSNSVLLAADLQALCAARGLATNGQKADLIARLTEQDAGAASQAQ